MSDAVGSATTTTASPAGSGAAGLESQLAKCQVQLADWVSCPSGKTPEGKAKIAALSDRISNIEQRMKTADAVRQNQKAASLKDSVAQSPSPQPDGAQPSPMSPPSIGSLGSRIDVHA